MAGLAAGNHARMNGAGGFACDTRAGGEVTGMALAGDTVVAMHTPGVPGNIARMTAIALGCCCGSNQRIVDVCRRLAISRRISANTYARVTRITVGCNSYAGISVIPCRRFE